MIRYKQFIQENFRIVNKNDRSVPFIFNPIQDKLFESLSGRDIVLKARQEGISSLVLALFTVDFLLSPNSRSVCISHDSDSTTKLFDRVKFFLKSFEEVTGAKIRTKYNSRTELVNEENNATFYVGAAGSKSFGRSSTLTNVHFSELAFYTNPEEIYLSASQAGTPKRIIIESTANGIGNLMYSMWNDSQERRSNYTGHFFGWNQYPEYTAPDSFEFDMSETELKLQNLYSLTKGQIAWRRVKMSEFPNEAMFRQEYPLTPEEAFISSGNPVFNIDSLIWYKQRKEMVMPPLKVGNLVGVKPPFFEENINGYLSIWKMPEARGQYVIGADPANGVKDGDYSCAQVLDRRSMEQVAVWHGRCDQDVFGQELNKLGYFYNSALVAPERNAGGIAVLLVLRELFYPNLYIREKLGDVADKLMPELGWSTDMKTKPIIISDSQQVIRDKQVALHDEHTIQELFSYAYDDAGHANATVGSHDDRVMALMIAIEMYKREPLIVPSINDIARPYVTQGNEMASDSNNEFYSDEPPLI